MRGSPATFREQTDRAVREAWADWGRGVAVTAVAGLFLALVGAFGTDDAPLAIRLTYWIGLMTGGALVGHILTRFMDRWTGFDTRPWMAGAVTVLLMMPPMTVAVWLATGFAFFGGPRLANLPLFAIPTLVVTAAATALNILVQRRPPSTQAALPNAAPVRFLSRLTGKLNGADLYAVEAEDHYLRLHTSAGSDLILLRLADAVAELEGVEGAQVHRSWWVAKAAVVSAKRGDGRATLTLKDGAQVPVSRNYARALREAGWF